LTNIPSSSKDKVYVQSSSKRLNAAKILSLIVPPHIKAKQLAISCQSNFPDELASKISKTS
jgi:hypothetical protein